MEKHKNLSEKQPKAKRAGIMAQVMKHKAQSSNPSNAKIFKKSSQIEKSEQSYYYPGKYGQHGFMLNEVI
jgi:hypothetical protein